jgi:hypothetical protein
VFTTDTALSETLDLGLCEVTGHYLLNDTARIVKDHVKSCYGNLSLFHDVGHWFKFGDIEIFKSVRTFFVHFKSKYHKHVLDVLSIRD